jgi:hypothetical protein
MEWWSDKLATEGDQFFGVVALASKKLAVCCFPGIIDETEGCDPTGIAAAVLGKGRALLDYAKAT